MGRLLLSLFTLLFSQIHAIHIGIVSDDTHFGEREVGWRIKRAAENLNWHVTLDEKAGEGLKKIKGIDFVISLVAHGIPHPEALNYLTIFHHGGFFDDSSQLLMKHAVWDGFLVTLDPAKYPDTFSPKELGSKYLIFYPTLQKIPYKQLPLNHLATMTPAWGNRIYARKYLELYQMLSQSGLVKFYGPLGRSDVIQKGYSGTLPFDGVSVVDALQQNGITLVLHSRYHLKQGLPTARIFEAAAGSTVIISDENAFVKKYFGDAVYYITVLSSSSIEIYAQIMDHLTEIRRNPAAAIAKAEKAHQIFEEQFTMEQQLLQLKMMCDQRK